VNLSPDTALVLITLIGVIVPFTVALLSFIERSRVAKAALIAAGVAAAQVAEVKAAAEVAAVKVEEVRVELKSQTSSVTSQLGTIHELVNSRLTAALEMIEELKALLRERAPDDPRVQNLDTGPVSALAESANPARKTANGGPTPVPVVIVGEKPVPVKVVKR
jgi:hypothetical protein